MQVLIVHEGFGAYRRGDVIKDPAEMEKALAAHPHWLTAAEFPDYFFMPDAEAHAAAQAQAEVVAQANAQAKSKRPA